MGFLFPLGLVFLILAIPIILFYLLKLRREEMTVSSNILWRKVLQDRQANAPWQKLQKNWLMFLQLLLLLILAAVLSQPFFESQATATGNIIVLLDSSATMQATDVSPNRFSKARQEVSNLIDQMGNSDKMTLVLMRSFPEVVATASSNKAELRNALDKAKVTNEAINAKGAITLAATNADRTPGTTVIVVSNGGFTRAEGLPPLRAKVRYIKIGESDNNQAITGLRLRESGVAPQLFIGLSNYAEIPAKATLQVTVDGKVFNTREVDIGANDKFDLTLTDLPSTTKVVNATIKPISGTQDFLAVDNQAWTVRNAGDPQKVLLVTTGNSFLSTLLTRMTNYKVSKIDPSEYEALKNKSDYNIFIFDEFAPDQLPFGAGVWLIGPNNSPFLPVTGSSKEPVVGRLEQNDPILRYTDLSSIEIAEAKQFEMPGWAHIVAAAGDGTPLIIAGERQGQRIAALSFNLHNSNLALNISWPILMVNTLGWLQPQGAVDAVSEAAPGEPVSFVVGSSNEQISVTAPGNGAQILKVINNVASFTDTSQTGVYQVTRRLDTVSATPSGGNTTTRPRVVTESFVVNLFSDTVSNIKPLEDLGLQGTNSGVQNNATVKTEREFWQPLALVALILLMLEWFIFYKGKITIFSRKKSSSGKTV
ncbi:MAG: BatA domain-containing protein [Chloroflexi bacterium]|uniref:BatA and WFA domain-containing protein n=1 Tax=Candidatus Chlorohelix allophototropha TaxID=3003348 RepID=A0A8T7LS77_9CHLR|nr:BatA domain-containing protein [Chloroflexota bacterium]WJW66756.1 BatA and WFA domain-containing protein [Chloroflexota bacterium L227-S17]